MRIVYLGAGSVATHLAPALQAAGAEICQVYSRTEDSAGALAERLHCEATTRTDAIRSDADLYLFSVKDDALPELIRSVPPNDGVWAHTAGSVPLSVFAGKCRQYGVLYPLQTFSRNEPVALETVPFFIEASDSDTGRRLHELAASVSRSVFSATSDQRRQLHLAAVFACNFTNLMYDAAARLLEAYGLPFEALSPLIVETARKITRLSPREAQTGPAVRWDESVMERHEALLQGDPALQAIYRMLSRQIHVYSQPNETDIP